MVTIARTIPVTPYLGGSINWFQNAHSVCRLNANNMVWTYNQTAPNWAYLALVNFPGGIATGSQPTITTNQMVQQQHYGSAGDTYVQVLRLNDSAVVVLDGNATTNMTAYELDGSNLFTQTARISTVTGTTSISPQITETLFGINAAAVGDNNFVIAYRKYIGSGTYAIVARYCSYDPVAKTLTAGNELTINAVATDWANGEVLVKNIPGTAWALVSSRAVPTVNSDSQGGNMAQNHRVVKSATQVVTISTTVFGDLTPITQTQWVNSYVWNSVKFFTFNPTTSQIVQNSSGFIQSLNNTVNQSVTPISENYFAIWNRSLLYNGSATVPLGVKIARRVDTNIVELSPANAALPNSGPTVNNGIPVLPAPNTLKVPANLRAPEMAGDRFMLWGVDSGTFKFVFISKS
jgi:hypothetical protein